MTEDNRMIHTSGGDYHEDNRTVKNNKGNINEKIEGDFVQQAPAQKQDLAQAAADIQKLLEQLEKTYSVDTTTGKMTIATKAVEQIENDPGLMQRVFSALKAGGIVAFEKSLNHPAASFAIAALKDWQNSKKD